MDPIGVLGGTFDPIHHGHLRLAQEVCEGLRFAHVRFVLAGVPPHREAPRVAAEQRREMVRLAISGNEQFVLDDRELKRNGPSYTVDTLRELRLELGKDQSLCLVIGSDAFLGLSSWHRWRELFDLSHIVLVQRPGAFLKDELLSQALREKLQERRVEGEALRNAPAGKIALCPITALDISASRIRAMLRCGRSPRYLLPDSVLDYIRAGGLYSQEADGPR